MVADLPFGSYQASPEQAFHTAVRFMKEADAHGVKLEGGAEMAPQVAQLVQAGIPVMAHIGFTPQSEHTLGGYRVQGRGETARKLLDDALALEAAGAFAVVHGDGARRRRRRDHRDADHPHDRHRRRASTATPRCSCGRTWSGCAPGRMPRFVKQYADLHGVMLGAAQEYVADVQGGTLPGPRAHLLS